MSEMSLAASRKARLAAMAQAGDVGAQAALALMEQPTQFLSTVQVGITSIGMLNGIVGEAAFSEGVARSLMALGLGEKGAALAATALVVAGITYFTIVFGELVPKRIGQLYPEAVARWVARPMQRLAKAASPFVRLLSGSTALVLKLLRVDTRTARTVTEEEITASLQEGVQAGLIEAHEHQMVRNVFHLDDRPLTSIMRHRADIAWLDASQTIAQSIDSVRAAAAGGVHSEAGLAWGSHSWYPVCRGGLDDVVGVVGLAQLLSAPDAQRSVDSLATSAVFVPETLSGMELLEQFRTPGHASPSSGARLVLVVDEYGVVQGLLTPSDMLEAITGELKPREPTDAWATALPGGAWQLDGLMPVTELKARLGLAALPGEARARYNTLGGLLLSICGHLPTVGEPIACAGWVFTVTALDGRRIDTVLAQAVVAA
jgi:putative hemolysin